MIVDLPEGLYVRLDSPPGPESQFVELETESGVGVGPETSGATWHQDGNHWLLGPFSSSLVDPAPVQ